MLPMSLYVWLMDPFQVKVVLKCFIITLGVPSVMIIGQYKMPLLCVISWDMMEPLRQYLMLTLELELV